MRLSIIALILALSITGTSSVESCVGKTLFIGIVATPQEQLLAELVSVLVTERTGTTVKVVTYKDTRQLYGAVKQGQVGLVIENTNRAFDALGKQREGASKAVLENLKAEYRKNLNLVWLESFGSAGDSSASLYAPVITVDVLGSLPALPKLLQKLSGIANDAGYGRLVKTVKGDEKPRKIARDYLKARKMI